MWSRPAAAGLVLGLAALGSAQPPAPPTRAVPPDAAALARLNLRTAWSQYLPVAGGRDTIQLIQTIDDQLFVQTRTGQLIAIDARTGRVQWQVAMGNGGYTNVYPVAVNSRFVFVANVTRAYAFYRDTGVVEFTADLGTTPVAGLAADNRGLYAVLASQPGGAGAHRVVAYDLPNPIVLADTTKGPGAKAGEQVVRAGNPVDDLTRRYPAPGAVRSAGPVESARSATTGPMEAPADGYGGSRTPSLAVVPRVVPPYKTEGDHSSPSLAIVPSLRQPYRLHDEAGKSIQRTPSIGTIPPSVAAALALSDLRTSGVRPKTRWEYGLTTRVLYAPLLTPSRVWIVTDVKAYLGLSKADRTVEVSGSLWDQMAAAPAQAGTTAYGCLSDGTLVSVDLEGGNRFSGVDVRWRTNIGGYPNRTPVVTNDAVFAGGDHSGVARVDRATGALVWRTDRQADQLLAVNQDFAYVRERQGKLLVYDARRATEPATGRAAPLTGLDLPEFNIPVVNTVSDRLFLASDNGLLVCLRDASAKYDTPVRMAPPVQVNRTPPRAAAPPAGGMPKDGAVPPEANPKGAEPKN